MVFLMNETADNKPSTHEASVKNKLVKLSWFSPFSWLWIFQLLTNVR